MKRIAVIRTFENINNVSEITVFTDATYLTNNNFITEIRVKDVNKWYSIGALNTDNPKNYLRNEYDTFEFTRDNDEQITITYEEMKLVYDQAEANLTNQYKLSGQHRIGIEYLIEVYKSRESWV